MGKYITADEARIKATEFNETMHGKEMTQISNSIGNAAYTGKSSITIEKISDQVKSELKRLGFTLEYKDADPRDGGFYEIRW